MAAELLERLEASGVVLTVEDGRLRANAPRGGLTPELKAAVSAARDELIALIMARVSRDGGTLTAIPRGAALPVSSFQRRLWVVQRMEPRSTDFNIVSVWKHANVRDLQALRAGIATIVRRHEVLHASFEEVDDVLAMQVLPPETVSVEAHDVTAYDEAQRAELVRSAIEAEAHRPFDLTTGPAVRFSTYWSAGHEAITLCTAHHIAVDAWSLSLLEKEFAVLVSGSSASLPAPTLQYADYAAWQEARLEPSLIAEDLTWWSEYLAGAPPLSVFTPDCERTAAQTGATKTFALDEAASAGLQAMVRREGATTYHALVAACAVVLRWHTGQEDMVVGSPMGVRERVEFESMIGPFVNLLVIRLDTSGDPTFADLLRRSRDSMLEAYERRHVPFERLLEHLKPARMADHTPLFQMAIVHQNAPGDTDVVNVSGGSMHELTWFVRQAAGQLACALEYRADLYSDAAIGGIADHLAAVLRGAVANPASRISELARLTGSERHCVIAAFNDTAADLPVKSWITLFEERVASEPHAIALSDYGRTLTYSELNARANRLAHLLRRRGVTRGALVGVCLERSLELVVALLAIQKAGGAYVPLDPGFPADRLAFMLADSEASLLVTGGDAVNALEVPETVQIVNLDAEADLPAQSPANPSCELERDDPAYVIYTSGSTGRPKGVVVPHGALVNFLCSMAREPGLSAKDILAAVTTISFDIAALELYLPLLVGARIELVSRETASDGQALAQLLAETRTTVLQATPATWRLLLEAEWSGGPHLRALCGGEPLLPELAAALLDRVGELWNLYGPTETTVWSTVERVAREGPVTIGRPIDNTQVYVLDANLEPVPIGAPGELWIGGAGVAAGYHRRPELTTERFVVDRFSSEPGARMYRTGDLARWRADGRLQHLGRLDHQVKIRGFRIELGEIETVLASHPAIRHALVMAREAGAGDWRLVAYLVYHAGQDMTVSDVRRYLRRTLPDYMVPSVVVALDVMPLTPNGKVDRGALVDPFRETQRAVTFEPPATGTEQLLADVWRDVLNVDRVGADDNFFELGGHSLHTFRVAAAVQKRLGWRMDPRTLFFQTLRQIAAMADTGMADSTLTERSH